MEGGGWLATRLGRFTPGKDPVAIVVQEARVGDLGAHLDGHAKTRLHRDSSPDRPARSELLYWLRYPGI